MKIDGKYKPQEVYKKHFYRLVTDTKTAQSAMNHQIKTMAEKIIEAAPSLKASLAEEGLTSDVFKDIIALIEERAQALSE